MEWYTAQEFCSSMHNSYLVEIFNQDQQNFIKKKAKKIQGSDVSGTYFAFKF